MIRIAWMIALVLAPGPLDRIAELEDTRSLGKDGELLGYLSHGNPEVRGRACIAAGRIQDPTAIPPLRGRLRDGDASVRREAIFALGQIGLIHPEAFRSELETLQDKITPRPYSLIERRIRIEFGEKPDTLFKEFDRRPLASASLGQVHRAVLHTGEEVAVKVQHWAIDKMVESYQKIR